MGHELPLVRLLSFGMASAGCLLTNACSRPSESTSPPAPSAAAVSPVGSGGVAPVRDAGDDARTAAVRAHVQAWSRALDAHDVASLEPYYAANVCFYGRVTTRAAVIAAKRAALGPQSTFHQEIVGVIDVRQQSDGAVVAAFVKRSGPRGSLRDLPAKVILRPRRDDPGALVILEEADATDPATANTPDPCASEAWSKGEGPSPAAADRCEETAAARVRELPDVKSFLADSRKAGDAIGGTGPEDDGTGVLTFALGFHTRDRFEPHVVYTIDRKTGAMTVSVDGADESVPKAAAQAVADACKR